MAVKRNSGAEDFVSFNCAIRKQTLAHLSKDVVDGWQQWQQLQQPLAPKSKS